MTEPQGKKELSSKKLKKATSEPAQFALKTRGSWENLFILITMGDLLGVPILRSYYSLRIIPYVKPQLETWKRRMLQEKDFTDVLSQE
jgi:hypothetical protein